MKEYTECDLLKNSTLKNYKCFVMLEPGANNQLWSVAVSHFSQSKITNTPAPCFFLWSLQPVTSSCFDKGPAGVNGYGLKVPASAVFTL